MHDVLDPRDIVPDEAEQLRLSGYPVGALEAEARSAAEEADLPGLARIRAALAELERAPGGEDVEPEDDATLMGVLETVGRLAVPRDRLKDRVRGAWKAPSGLPARSSVA